VLEFRTVTAGARIGRRLRVSPATELVYAARLRLVDGAPIALEYLHIPADLVPGLTPERMEAGFYAHLREERGVVTARAVQSIEPTVLSEDEAEPLGVPVLSPALPFDRVTSDGAGRPVEYVRSLLTRRLLPHRLPPLPRPGRRRPTGSRRLARRRLVGHG
jgi:GntR family transcriptional regulator